MSVVDLVTLACERIAELRTRRIGKRASAELAEDLWVINRLLASRSEERGIFLAQKAFLFNHDVLFCELGNVKALLHGLEKGIRNPEVKKLITSNGYSVVKVHQAIGKGLQLVGRYRASVDAHEYLLQQGLEGVPVSDTMLKALEKKLLDFHLWEEKILQASGLVLEKIKQYNAEARPRGVAALALAIANACLKP